MVLAGLCQGPEERQLGSCWPWPCDFSALGPKSSSLVFIIYTVSAFQPAPLGTLKERPFQSFIGPDVAISGMAAQGAAPRGLPDEPEQLAYIARGTAWTYLCSKTQPFVLDQSGS